MKCFSLHLCNLESRMRKEAAENLQKEFHLQAELREKVSRKIKVDDDSGKTFYTTDSLLFKILFLWGGKFLSIAFFLSYTHVHLWRYGTDDEGFLHPTKDGVSLSPSVWHWFQQKCYYLPGHFLIVDKDMCPYVYHVKWKMTEKTCMRFKCYSSEKT